MLSPFGPCRQCRVTGLVLLLSLAVSACGYPRFVSLPTDRSGRGVNSFAEELSPQVNNAWLVFVSDRNGSQGIYLYNRQTKRLEAIPRLNALNQVASHPSITADGRYLVYALSRNGDSDIMLYDRQTEQSRNLTPALNAETRNPIINTDGDRIAFEVAEQGQWNIRVVDRQGNLISP